MPNNESIDLKKGFAKKSSDLLSSEGKMSPYSGEQAVGKKKSNRDLYAISSIFF